MDILAIVLGLFILYFGGETLINGAVSVARCLNISKALVSTVIVGFGTSMPELTVSVEAMLNRAPEIAIGNVISSNIVNSLFILGISALISPFCLKNKFIKRDIYVMLGSTITLCLLALLEVIGFIQGIFLLAVLVIYVTYSYFQDKDNLSQEEPDTGPSFFKNLNLPLSIFFSLLGITLLIVGSSLFLDGAIAVATKLNIRKDIVGLGIVAIGSSLPELTTVVVASIKRNSNIVISSIVGSNIFNILSIVGVISLIDDITIPKDILKFDLWVFLGATIIISCLLLKNIRFSRGVGFLFLSAYTLYFYTLFYSA